MCAEAMPELIVKEDRKARKPWITREIINKMDERRKRKNVNKEGRKEGRKNYNTNEERSKRAIDKAKFEYLESTCDLLGYDLGSQDP
jgi:hypothetical protein